MGGADEKASGGSGDVRVYRRRRRVRDDAGSSRHWNVASDPVEWYMGGAALGADRGAIGPCEASYRVTEIEGVGVVESWVELTDVSEPLVSFRWTWVFAADGEVLTSDSTLCFRERDEVEATLVEHGYAVDEVRGAPDRPGRELVFFARRPG